MPGDHLECSNCGHDWHTRVDEPKKCPQCGISRRYADFEEVDDDE